MACMGWTSTVSGKWTEWTASTAKGSAKIIVLPQQVTLYLTLVDGGKCIPKDYATAADARMAAAGTLN